MKKILKKLGITFGSIVAFFLVLVLGVNLFFKIPVKDYYKNATAEFVIPGIHDGIVPQGIDYDELTETFYVIGYHQDKGVSSCLFAVKNNEIIKKIDLLKPNGEPFTGHSGGISIHGNYFYIAGSSDGGLFVLNYQDVINAKDGDKVAILSKKFETSFPDGIRVSFVTDSKDHIYVGEYYKASGYNTPESHHYNVDGKENGGLLVEYEFDSSFEYGINPTPTKIISIVDIVQGVYVEGNDLYLSTSAFFNTSHIYKFDMNKMSSLGNMEVLGKDIKVFGATEKALTWKIPTPPMSEEIVLVGNKLYTITEFASNKFIVGKFTGAYRCYALDVSKYN